LPAKAASLALQFFHLVPLSTALHITPSSCQRTHRKRLQTLPVEARVLGLQCVQAHMQSVRNVFEGERKLRLRSCQATYQFFYSTLAVCRDQAFLCF